MDETRQLLSMSPETSSSAYHSIAEDKLREIRQQEPWGVLDLRDFSRPRSRTVSTLNSSDSQWSGLLAFRDRGLPCSESISCSGSSVTLFNRNDHYKESSPSFTGVRVPEEGVSLASSFAQVLRSFISPPGGNITNVTEVHTIVTVRPPVDDCFLSRLIHELAPNPPKKVEPTIEEKENYVRCKIESGRFLQRRKACKKWVESIKKDHEEKIRMLKKHITSKSTKECHDDKKKGLEDELIANLLLVKKVELGELQLAIKDDGSFSLNEEEENEKEIHRPSCLYPEVIISGDNNDSSDDSEGRDEDTSDEDSIKINTKNLVGWKLLGGSKEDLVKEVENEDGASDNTSVEGERKRRRESTPENSSPDKLHIRENKRFKDLGKDDMDITVEYLDKIEHLIGKLGNTVGELIERSDLIQAYEALSKVRKATSNLSIELVRLAGENSVLEVKLNSNQNNSKGYVGRRSGSGPMKRVKFAPETPSSAQVIPSVIANSSIGRFDTTDDSNCELDGPWKINKNKKKKKAKCKDSLETNTVASKITYASKAGGSKVEKVHPQKEKASETKPERSSNFINTVLITSMKDQENKPRWASLDDLRKVIKQELKPKLGNIKVVGFRSRLRKVAFEIEGATLEDRDSIIKCPHLQELGLIASPLQEPGDTVSIVGVEKSMTPTELLEEIWDKNLSRWGFDRSILGDRVIPRFTRSCPWLKEEKLVRWIVEVPPQVKEVLLEKGSVNIDWASLPVKNYNWITRCFRCLRVGHYVEDCKQKEITYGHCGKLGHKYEACSSKEVTPKCVPCLENKRPSDHSILDVNCTEYQRALRRLINNRHNDRSA